MGAEDLAHPSLGHRLTARGAAQHHEHLLGGQPCWTFGTQIGRQLGEKRPIDGHDPFTATLAGHPHLTQPEVNTRQRQATNLGGP